MYYSAAALTVLPVLDLPFQNTEKKMASAMHQFAIWTMLEDAGLGASLQHYNPLIDEEVRRTWNLPNSWMLIAEMPFGTPTAEPDEKEFQDLSERIKIFL